MDKIVYYGCGLNINNQLHSTKCSILCCPIELQLGEHKTQQSISFAELHSISLSHIIWMLGKDVVVCGYKSSSIRDAISSITNPKLIKSCESRLVLIDENDIIACTSKETKKIYFQYSEDQKNKFNLNSETVDVAVEDNLLITINKDGKLFDFGIEVPLSVKISRVCVGKEHCLALTSEREVLSWGSGMKGQLGNGEITVVEHPEKVEALEGLKFESIECGGWHSVALSESGDVYVWGWNDVGQLGLPSKSLRSSGVKWDEASEIFECQCQALHLHEKCDTGKEKQDGNLRKGTGNLSNFESDSKLTNIQTFPKVLECWSINIPVKKIACGDRHTAFLLANGSAWTTGWNMYGQLGIGCIVSQDEPQKVNIDNVVDLFAGGWNTIFAVS